MCEKKKQSHADMIKAWAAGELIRHRAKVLTMCEKKKHKHADMIKAWADGELIQFRPEGCALWLDIAQPDWGLRTDYRVKPKLITLRVLENGMSIHEFSVLSDSVLTIERAD